MLAPKVEVLWTRGVDACPFVSFAVLGLGQAGSYGPVSVAGRRVGEALRERDILHHVNDQHKFKDDRLIYRMRAVEGIEGDGSSVGPTVPQLLNQSRYMMGAWFLKQVRSLPASFGS
jgi:hypothetical protein